ncbi:hypothetical protein T09_7473, partial [Trichinella sp. T9]
MNDNLTPRVSIIAMLKKCTSLKKELAIICKIGKPKWNKKYSVNIE